MKLIVVLLLGIWGATGVVAQTTFPNGMTAQDVQRVINAAANAVGYSAQIDIASARRYPACDHPPAVQPLGQSWETVQLTCKSPRTWKRSFRTAIDDRVRPAQTEKITEKESFFVLNKSLARGAVIVAQDLELRQMEAGMVTMGFSQQSNLIGRRLSQHLGKGRIILARHLEQNWMVEQGQPVQIVFNLYGIEVLAPGKALDRGQMGDLILVENTATSQHVRGLIASKNKIVVRAKIQ